MISVKLPYKILIPCMYFMCLVMRSSLHKDISKTYLKDQIQWKLPTSIVAKGVLGGFGV